MQTEAQKLVERLFAALSAEADWAAPGPNDECVKGNHCAVCQETGECIAALLIEADSFLTRTRGE